MTTSNQPPMIVRMLMTASTRLGLHVYRAASKRWLALVVMLACALNMTASVAAENSASEEARVLQHLRDGGVAILLRHAQTVPGIGDPPGFRLGACDTQRNLSAQGRAAAARFGERMSVAGVRFSQVLTSQWCRCRDTATAITGTAEDWPALNSFFDDRSTEARQSAEVRKRIAAIKRGETLLLVTHQVNITALTGVVPAMGEAVVVRAGKGGVVEVVGRLAGG